MTRTTLVRVGSFALLCAAATLSLSLTAPTKPLGAQTDSDPQNPANWEFRTLEREGDDNAHRYEYKSTGGYELATYYRNWDEMQWYRNGIALGSPYSQGPQVPIPMPTMVGEAPAVDWSSQGTVTMVIEWIGEGAPPASVRLQVTGTIEILVATGGDADADDGFGSELESEPWSGGTHYFIDDYVVETYVVDQNSGYCEIEVEKFAIAESYDVNGYAFSDARHLTVEIDPDPKPRAASPASTVLAGFFGHRYLSSILDFVRR